MTAQSNSGTYNFKGLGHQVKSEVKKMEAIRSTLEDAALQLGHPSEHVRLQGFINAAIEEANSLASSADERLNLFI